MKNRSGHERVLLISNSTLHGSGYLDHAESEIRSFLRGVSSVLFVPYALYDRDAYASMVQKRFEEMGYSLESIHTAGEPQQALSNAESIFIGGGNTFRLLKTLYDRELLGTIRALVRGGAPYIGTSAGTNITAPRFSSS